MGVLYLLPHLHLTFQSLHWKEIMEDACAFSMSNFQIGFYLYVARYNIKRQDNSAKLFHLCCSISKEVFTGEGFSFFIFGLILLEMLQEQGRLINTC